MQSLLARLGKHRPVPASLCAYPRRLSAREPGGIQPANALSTTILRDPLTMREIDILVLMRARLSNKEIARELSIAHHHCGTPCGEHYAQTRRPQAADCHIKAEERADLLPPR
ncbi:MAG: hypothetical protein U0X20_14535 [Caldilineaceae bacterium]